MDGSEGITFERKTIANAPAGLRLLFFSNTHPHAATTHTRQHTRRLAAIKAIKPRRARSQAAGHSRNSFR
jgi:hypothetical protein